MIMRAAVGIDIGGTSIKTGIVGEDGSLLRRRTVPTEAQAGAEALKRKLAGIVREALAYGEQNGIEIAGAGIGTAGQVLAGSGMVAGATANLPGWAGVPLGPWLRSETGLDVAVDNDVNMIAAGEAWLGAGKRWDDFLCVALGTGIGGCLVIGRRVYHGRDGFAGEIGHQTVVIDGLPCSCGGRGCWEQYASVTALMRLAAESPASGAPRWESPTALFDAARRGDGAAVAVIDLYARYVAVGLANLIHALNPPAIVIGGAVTAQGDFLFERIRRETALRLMPAFREAAPVPIVPAALGEDAGVIGAAGVLLAMRRDGRERR